jgi:hypothetical protein
VRLWGRKKGLEGQGLGDQMGELGCPGEEVVIVMTARIIQISPWRLVPHTLHQVDLLSP